MPYYQYRCQCGNSFDEMFSIHEDSLTTQCPKCKGIANKVIGAPGVMGLNKGPNMTVRGRSEYNFDRVDALQETKDLAKKMEEAGKLDPVSEHCLKSRIKGLEEKKAKGEWKPVDYQKVGHPLET